MEMNLAELFLEQAPTCQCLNFTKAAACAPSLCLHRHDTVTETKRDSVVPDQASLLQVREEGQSLRSQVEASKADNLALLERLKYVRGYQSSTRPRKGEARACIPIAGGVQGLMQPAFSSNCC